MKGTTLSFWLSHWSNTLSKSRDFRMSLFVDNTLKSLAIETSKLLRLQVSTRFIALKLRSTVAVPTGSVLDTLTSCSKLLYKFMFIQLPAFTTIAARSHSDFSNAMSMVRQSLKHETRGDMIWWFKYASLEASSASRAAKTSIFWLLNRLSSSLRISGVACFLRLSQNRTWPVGTSAACLWLWMGSSKVIGTPTEEQCDPATSIISRILTSFRSFRTASISLAIRLRLPLQQEERPQCSFVQKQAKFLR